ncbi:MAG: sensor histidine kinase [Acidobacteriota bacterium]|nr:sensor histidine kinase [Acidobacteriota bacterium]
MLRRITTPFILVLAYLLFLLILSGEGILQATYSIAEQVRTAETSYRLTDDALEAIRLDIYQIAVPVRNGLQNRRPEDARAAVVEYQSDIEKQFQFLRQDGTAAHIMNMQQLEDEVHSYLKALNSVTDQVYSTDSTRRLDNALGQRQGIVNISEVVSKGNDSNFESEQKAIGDSIRSLRAEISTTLALIGLLGITAGGAALHRMLGIEKSNQQAHGKLKSLSRQLVSAQEAERKALSRELHDEIGQSLTALKLELANGEKTARAEGSAVSAHFQLIREIADQTLRATKNISLGLRPPMLDDLGLVPALNWYTAEFSKRTGIAINLSVDGAVNGLSEAHRTCVFRIVQESLTNCARHSQAKSVTVQLDIKEELLTLTVSDNGAGFLPVKSLGTGLGLLSMQERAAELGGNFAIDSFPGKGTRIQIVIPIVTPIMV